MSLASIYNNPHHPDTEYAPSEDQSQSPQRPVNNPIITTIQGMAQKITHREHSQNESSENTFKARRIKPEGGNSCCQDGWFNCCCGCQGGCAICWGCCLFTACLWPLGAAACWKGFQDLENDKH